MAPEVERAVAVEVGVEVGVGGGVGGCCRPEMIGSDACRLSDGGVSGWEATADADRVAARVTEREPARVSVARPL
jgi:hypothetical protein